MSAEATGSESTQPSAEIIELFASHEERIDPSDLTDTECISFFASQWLHPSVVPHTLAEKITMAVQAGENTWNTRLNGIVNSAPFFDRYDEFLKDPVFADIIVFLQESKKHTDELKLERKAAMALAEMCSVVLDSGSDTERLGKVFAKLPHDLSHQS